MRLSFSKEWSPNKSPPSRLLETSETCNDFSNLTPLQRAVYDQIFQLQKREEKDPENNDKLEFLKTFWWDTCVLNVDQKRQLQEFLVEYQDVFAKNCFGVGYYTEHPIPVYV